MSTIIPTFVSYNFISNDGKNGFGSSVLQDVPPIVDWKVLEGMAETIRSFNGFKSVILLTWRRMETEAV